MPTGLLLDLLIGAGVLLFGIGSGAYGMYEIDQGKYQALVAQHASEDAARTAASLKQFQDIAKQINDAAQRYVVFQGSLGNQIDLITKDLHNVTSKRLPVDCKPDVGRLRVLHDAITAANSASR